MQSRHKVWSVFLSNTSSSVSITAPPKCQTHTACIINVVMFEHSFFQTNQHPLQQLIAHFDKRTSSDPSAHHWYTECCNGWCLFLSNTPSSVSITTPVPSRPHVIGTPCFVMFGLISFLTHVYPFR